MSGHRYSGTSWDIRENGGGGLSLDSVAVVVLQDIRDELKRLNGLLHCPNFVTLPSTLRDIKRNTTKRRRKRTATP